MTSKSGAIAAPRPLPRAMPVTPRISAFWQRPARWREVTEAALAVIAIVVAMITTAFHTLLGPPAWAGWVGLAVAITAIADFASARWRGRAPRPISAALSTVVGAIAAVALLLS